MQKTNDQLWKGVIEELFEDFASLLLPELFPHIDFYREITFLDKELEQIYSEKDDKLRLVDKLVKVFTKEGVEQWILIHIEVQGYVDTDFSKRMYVYYNRLNEKYEKPICALAIFTDKNPNYEPNAFEQNCFGTSVVYKYLTYKVLSQDISILQNSQNPFATIIETAFVALKKNKIKDNELLELKVDLVRRLFRKNFSKIKIRAIMNFIHYYVRFNSKATNELFEQKIEQINQKSYPMGIEEILLAQAKNEGFEQGVERGIEQGIEQGVERGLEQGIEKMQKIAISKMLEKSSLEEIADFLEITIDDVITIISKYNLSK